MGYKNEDIVEFLRILNRKGSVLKMRQLGYSFSEIAEFIEWLFKNVFLERVNGDVELTHKAHSFLADNKDKNNNGGIIIIKDNRKVEKIQPFDIYLPHKSEINF